MEQPPQTRRLKLPGGTGAELAARIDAPSERAQAAFLLLHSFGSSKDLKSSTRIATALAAAGYFVLRIDFTGAGQSDGDFAKTTFSTHVADALAAAQWLRAQPETEGRTLFIFGHSMGGLVGIRAARTLPECRGVALLGVPSSTAHLAEILERRAPEIMQTGEGEVETIGMRVRVGQPMLVELRAHNALADIAALDAELFVIHSKSDEVASVDHAETLFAAARAPKSLMLLDGADHLLLARETDAHVVGKTVAAWAEGILLARSS